MEFAAEITEARPEDAALVLRGAIDAVLAAGIEDEETGKVSVSAIDPFARLVSVGAR